MTNPANGEPRRDWTPEQKAKIYAEMKKKFTVEDLLQYINDDGNHIPAEQVLAEVEAIVRDAESRKNEEQP